jgi:hypothetical protein
LFSGKFPYAARTHLGNGFSYFPFFFVVALPFYFLQEIGFMSLAAVLGYCYVTEKMMERERDRFLNLLFITLMPTSLWEYAVRSTILFNTVLFLIYFYYAEKYSPWKKWSGTVIFGILAGLMLSTRAVFGLLLIAYVANKFLRNRMMARGAVFLTFAGTVLGLTLLPFALWDWTLFQVNNPITFQASFIPAYALPFLAFLAVWMGYTARHIADFYRSLGILLFLAAGTAFVDSLLNQGWNLSVMQSGFDISYFIFSAPFLTVSLYLSAPETQD